MNKFVQQTAADMGLSLDGPLSRICQQARISRTQVYERKNQIEDALAQISLAGPGHPLCPCAPASIEKGFELRERILQYRLNHPGALIVHTTSNYTTYGDSFIRFILDLSDQWQEGLERFCEHAQIPYQTVRFWREKDRRQPYKLCPVRQYVTVPGASEDARRIAEDYSVWEGSLRDFFKYETARLNIGPVAIRRVLVIFGMLPGRSAKRPRYRGATRRCRPGSILVTDGKTVDAVSIASGQVRSYNWQGIVDQATACHTAVVVTDAETAAGVRKAFDRSCHFLGRPSQALVHDNKPIHDDQHLRNHIEKTTLMIPATPGRGQNKAVIEGEFGKFEQAVGALVFDDSSKEALIKSAVGEALRAYTAGINHAGRVEFDGKSRQDILRQACPDPEKDRRFIEQLHAAHTGKQRIDVLPSRLASRVLLNEGFERFEIAALDPKGEVRQWLAGRYTPEAIRQGLAIFGTERNKGRLKNKTAHRYLVKVIQNCQDEIDLRVQEELLREYAEVERSFWLHGLEADYEMLTSRCDGTCPEKDLALQLGDNAIFGGLILQRAFWENKLKTLLEKQRDRFAAVCNHVRRLFEVKWEHR
ncbi:MAG: hypothetical protein Q8P24_16050 [Desulfobacterales bacterium]|nr:hypothetical protein [Desulfobacterales bacterium]